MKLARSKSQFNGIYSFLITILHNHQRCEHTSIEHYPGRNFDRVKSLCKSIASNSGTRCCNSTAKAQLRTIEATHEEERYCSEWLVEFVAMTNKLAPTKRRSDLFLKVPVLSGKLWPNRH